MHHFYFFILTGIILTITETMIPSNIFILSLGLSFIFQSIIAIFVESLSTNFITLIITSSILYVLIRTYNPIFQRGFFKIRNSYLGKKIIIDEIISSNQGLAKIHNEIWPCECDNLKKGQTYVIKKVDLNKLIVERENRF